jgi:hypothetical protein
MMHLSRSRPQKWRKGGSVWSVLFMTIAALVSRAMIQESS